MCGILGVHGLEKPASDRAHFIAMAKKLRHRGPDWSGCYVGKHAILVHERLAIVGVGEDPDARHQTEFIIIHRHWCTTSNKPRRPDNPCG